MTPKETEFYLKNYGFVPWTVTIAEYLENGGEWDKKHIAEVLRAAQKEIDKATATKENK